MFGKTGPVPEQDKVLNLHLSKVSQDDIIQRNTFEEIEQQQESQKGFVSSIMSIKENAAQTPALTPPLLTS